MLDFALFSSVAAQLMGPGAVVVAGETLAVERVASGRLKTVRFRIGERNYQAIEQNPQKPSRWGQLAHAGHHVVQFKDVATNRYVAVAVDGEIHEYGHK
jgi:hypothetical protein